MHKLLEKLFKEKGIESRNDLNEMEKKTYDAWNERLMKDKPSIDDLEEFIEGEIKKLTEKVIEPDLSKEEDLYLKARIADYKAILKIIERPTKDREQLKSHIKKLIKKE